MKNIFSKILMAVAIVVAPLALSSCDNEDNWFGGGVIISGPGVVHQAATLEAGQTLQLSATKGALIAGKGFAWTSSDPAIATVDQNGLVTAIAAGEVTITCSTTGSDVITNGSITIYVLGSSIALVDDQIDQSEAE